MSDFETATHWRHALDDLLETGDIIWALLLRAGRNDRILNLPVPRPHESPLEIFVDYHDRLPDSAQQRVLRDEINVALGICVHGLRHGMDHFHAPRTLTSRSTQHLRHAILELLYLVGRLEVHESLFWTGHILDDELRNGSPDDTPIAEMALRVYLRLLPSHSALDMTLTPEPRVLLDRALHTDSLRTLAAAAMVAYDSRQIKEIRSDMSAEEWERVQEALNSYDFGSRR